MKINNIYKKIIRLFVVVSFIFTNSAQAGLIFESGQVSGQPSGGGIYLNDNYFVMHRFYLDDTYFINSIGGNFEADRNRNIFGAIVGLTGEDDFPDSHNLETSDVLGNTLLTIGSVDGDYFGDLSLSLTQGWYALAFGSGKFGADSIGFIDDIVMPDVAIDLSSDLPITAINEGNPFNMPAQYTYQSVNSRFIVKGQLVTSVPEPSTLALLLLSFFVFSRSRKM